MTTPPTISRYLNIGQRQELGKYHFTAEKIIRFAEKFDPQPFHLSKEGGAASFLGGLCASGWHTTSVWMKMQREFTAKQAEIHRLEGIAPLEYGPSPGFEELSWPRPVFAGETITFYTTNLSVRPSNSRTGWHIATGQQFAQTKQELPVMSFQSSFFCRAPN